MDKDRVLSVTPNKDALVVRETALQNAGFKVTSVMSRIQARFEIEMGRCGTLLICYRLTKADAAEMARLFRRYCRGGRIIFVTEAPAPKDVPVDADVTVPESSGAELIVQALREPSPLRSPA
jgi:DNA-binding response OmpR family regulator